ncbi:hypothetical protein SDC9_69159 [bioreactor metagenome]|uniref:Uncharacterized protein n=1 Tax=bioreactor metagenome TaxID=1076179 RepID=A0A644Y468_9ZZZZ
MAVLDAQNALEAYHTTRPGAQRHLVDVAAVGGLAVAVGRTGGQLRPGAHDALPGWELVAGELDPLVLQQTFHGGGLLS